MHSSLNLQDYGALLYHWLPLRYDVLQRNSFYYENNSLIWCRTEHHRAAHEVYGVWSLRNPSNSYTMHMSFNSTELNLLHNNNLNIKNVSNKND